MHVSQCEVDREDDRDTDDSYDEDKDYQVTLELNVLHGVSTALAQNLVVAQSEDGVDPRQISLKSNICFFNIYFIKK